MKKNFKPHTFQLTPSDALKFKAITLENKVNGEKVIWLNRNARQWIDGVEYLQVYRENSSRPFLMRRDALKEIKLNK
jgi:hypothetical protein